MTTSTRRRAAWAGISVLVALVVMGVITSVVVAAVTSTAIRQSQVDNTTTLTTTEQTLALLLDCTDPDGDCYQAGQDSQRRAIDDITVIAATAAACANQAGNTTVRAVLDCTLRELDAATP